MTKLQTIHVQPETLVCFDGVGLHISAGLNDPEFGSQPYVTINTEELAREHRYGPEPELPTDSELVDFALMRGATREYVADADTDQLITDYGDLFMCWAREANAGLPIIAVHLNDCTIFDDEGAGPIHQGDSVRDSQHVELEKALRDLVDRLSEPGHGYSRALQNARALLDGEQ
jgi:hypothetical protein